MYTEVGLRLVRALLILVGSLAVASPSLRLDSPADRSAFRRWFTFLAESRYYARKHLRDVKNGEDLVRWALRQALVPHDAAWAHTLELPVFPVMPSVVQSARPAPLAPEFISRDLKHAQPGDLLLFDRSDVPAHLMIYIGSSQIVPSRRKWVVYISEVVHKVCRDSLMTDPSPEWRPSEDNPQFLGVWRLDLL